MQFISKQIISGVAIGLILGIGSTFIFQGQKIAKLEVQIEALKERSWRISNSGVPYLEIPKGRQSIPKAEPEKLAEIIKELIEIIKWQQANHVKESWGPYDYQCFTDKDLEGFKKSKVTREIVSKLKKDNHFIDIVLAIKQMAPSDWQKLKESSLKTYKPTWAELGKIDRKGQTEAGQIAEKMIAEAIVELATDLRKQPVEDIKSLYSY